DQRELHLQLTLVPPMMAIKGYRADETRNVLHRARELIGDDADAAQSVSVLWGLWHIHFRADHVAARSIAEQLLAFSTRHPQAEVLGRQLMGLTCCNIGSFIEAREYLERTLDLCRTNPESGQSSSILSDHEVVANCYLSLTLWLLGYYDQSLAAAARGLTRAR